MQLYSKFNLKNNSMEQFLFVVFGNNSRQF